MIRYNCLQRLAAAIVVVFSVAACDSVEDRVASHYARGEALLEDGDTTRATLEFRNALRLDERHVPSRLAMARIYEAQGELRAAAANYRLVTEVDRTNPEAPLQLGMLMLASGAIEDAVALSETALALAPENPDAMALRAAVLFRQGSLEQAVETARSVLVIEPHHVMATSMLIAERRDGGDSMEALRLANDLLAAVPAEPTINLIKLQLLQDMQDEAAFVAHLEALTAMFPDRPQFKQALAQSYARSGDIERAEAVLRDLADQNPDDAEASLSVVRFILNARGIENARAEMQARVAAAKSPRTRARLRIAAAELDYRFDRQDAARETLAEVIEGGEQADAARLMLASMARSEGRNDDARALADTILADDPDNVDALSFRAEMLIQQDEPQAAIADIRHALGLAPQETRLMMLEATAHERLGNLDLAGERLASAARTSGFEPTIALTYANFLRGRNQLSATESVLTETARRHPTNRTVLIRLADLYIATQNWDGAEQVAATLGQIEGSSVLSSQVRAAALSQQGRFDESIALLRDIEQNDQTDATLVALVRDYLRNNELEQAKGLLDQAIERDPENIRARVIRAGLFYAEGQTERTEEALRDVIMIAPTDQVGYLAMAAHYRRLDEPGKAMDVLEVALQRVTQDAMVRQSIAELSELQSDFDRAIEEYALLYERNPNSLLVANNYASLLAEHREDDPAAIATAARVAQRLRASTIPELKDTYGWISFLTGDAEDAIRFLREAAEERPNNALIRYHHGRVLAQLGQHDMARAELETSLAIDPGFAKASSARAALDALSAQGG